MDAKTYLNAGQTVASNLILDNYHHLGLSEAELVFYFQLIRWQQAGNLFPDLQAVATTMGRSREEVYRFLEGLIDKKIVRLDTRVEANGQRQDIYNFEPLLDRLDQLKSSQQQQTKKQAQVHQERHVYQTVQQEFGRNLSPLEMETIAQWLQVDHYQPEVIILALKEAVLNQAYNLNYMDRILLSWERKNLRSKQQIVEEQKRRKGQLVEKEWQRQQQATPSQTDAIPKVPLYNWLEPDKSKE